MKLSLNQSLPQGIREFLQFVIVGVINTLLNYAVFLLLFKETSVHYLVAGASGFFSGAGLGYILNRAWTFQSKVPALTGAFKYLLVQCVCLGAHLAAQSSVIHLFAVPVVWSQLAGIVVTTFLNFFLSRKWVFTKTTLPEALS
jgi:putative flippase GtrA